VSCVKSLYSIISLRLSLQGPFAASIPRVSDRLSKYSLFLLMAIYLHLNPVLLFFQLLVSGYIFEPRSLLLYSLFSNYGENLPIILLLTSILSQTLPLACSLKKNCLLQSSDFVASLPKFHPLPSRSVDLARIRQNGEACICGDRTG
jgi:hypothetical protein